MGGRGAEKEDDSALACLFFPNKTYISYKP